MGVRGLPGSSQRSLRSATCPGHRVTSQPRAPDQARNSSRSFALPGRGPETPRGSGPRRSPGLPDPCWRPAGLVAMGLVWTGPPGLAPWAPHAAGRSPEPVMRVSSVLLGTRPTPCLASLAQPLRVAGRAGALLATHPSSGCSSRFSLSVLVWGVVAGPENTGGRGGPRGPEGGTVSVRDPHTCLAQADRPSWGRGRRPRGRWRPVAGTREAPRGHLRRHPGLWCGEATGRRSGFFGAPGGSGCSGVSSRLVAALRGRWPPAWSPRPASPRGGRCAHSLGLPRGPLALRGLSPQRVSLRGHSRRGRPLLPVLARAPRVAL